jgi:hypothetical protein
MQNKNISMENKALKLVIDHLLSDKFYNAGELTERAKGKYEYSKGLKVNFRKLKRQLKTLKK